MQPDRAQPRTPKLASGMFGDAAPLTAGAEPAASTRKEPRDRTALDLQHLFGRDAD